MFTRLLLFLSVFSTLLWADANLSESPEDKTNIHDQEFLFVSLGSLCRTADILRECGLRSCAFPFDWIISNDAEKLIELLDNDFCGFITADVPFVEERISLARGGLTLLHPGYHMEFSHESSKDETGRYFIDWPTFRSKFERRIARFRELAHFKGRVFFVRSSWSDCGIDPYLTYRSVDNMEISDAYALKLFDALKRKFSQLDCGLIIRNESEKRGVAVRQIAENVWVTWSNHFPLAVAVAESKEFYLRLLEEWRSNKRRGA